MRTLTGQVSPLSGEFTFGGNVEAGYFDQQTAVINDMNPEQTVFDNFHDEYPRLTNEQVRSALGAFAFTQEEVERKLGQLSGGERVRLALCKMLFTRPNFLILDEPTNHLDVFGKDALEQMLNEYTGTVLFVSHDRYFIKRIATQILDFENDGVEFYPYPYEEYLEERKKRAERKESGYRSENTNADKSVEQQREPSIEDDETLARARNLGVSSEVLDNIRRNPGKERSKIERKIEKLETEMSSSEELLSSLKEQYNDPEAAADYERLGQLEKEIHEQEELQEELLGQIMEQEELLAFVESVVSSYSTLLISTS